MILIVDDNQENIFSLKKLLEIHKFEVETALSGDEALKKIIKRNYALIILDVQMPEMDGFEVAETISGYSKSKDIPIIFLSAVNTDKRFITKGYSSGGIDYITKPFDPDILLLKVKTFYRLSEQTRRLNEMEQALREEIDYRKKAEVMLREYVEELQSILETIPQIAFTLDEHGGVEFVNHLWYDYSPDKNHFPASENLSIQTLIDRALDTREQLVSEIKIRKLHDDQFTFHVLYLTPVMKAGTIVKWVGIFTNVHEQKTWAEILERKVEERTAELARTNRWLENSNHELKQFAYIASHDLQEPLRKIQTFTNMVISRHAPDDERAIQYLTKIKTSADRLRHLVSDLLSYASIQSENLFVETDLSKIVQEVITDLELLIERKNATIEVGDLRKIEVIPSLMRQVIQNLLNNALKFTRENVPCHISIKGEQVADTSEHARFNAEGEYYRLTICDNGIGFNQSFVNKMFEIFQRLNGRAEYEGTGIGLALAKKIIERHGGSITARGKENQGACFIVVLPIKQKETAFVD